MSEGERPVAPEATDLFVDEDGVVHCFSCGFEYVHPISVRVNRGGEITTVDHEGTRMKAAAPAGRGVLISVTYQCESGHRFRWDAQFHKGLTTMTCHPEEREADPLNTIWRD